MKKIANALRVKSLAQLLDKPKKTKRRSNVPSERESQRTVVQYVRAKYPDVVIFAIPNGGSRNKIEAANLKRDGVLAGVPDLFIARGQLRDDIEIRNNDSCGHIHMFNESGTSKVFLGLFIEMKSKKGRMSESQLNIIDKLRHQPYRVEVCCSADEAIKVIDEYLS